MVVYADILMVLNFIVDYFLLSAAGRLLVSRKKLWRMLIGAGVGAVSALMIFLPQIHISFELSLRFITCLLMAGCAFGFRGIKRLLRSAGVLFAVTCGYAGIMIAFWYLFRPSGMVINNSVVYFNISPVILIAATVAGYIIFLICGFIFSKSAAASEKCSVTVFVGGESENMTAIVDTGNSATDIFSKSEIIIADEAHVKRLFGDIGEVQSDWLKSRYRVIPCSTVSGGGMLEGYRCDKAVVESEKRKIVLEKPVLAVSKTALNDDYSAIVNPNIFL